MDFAAAAELCAPSVASRTLSSIALVESTYNPFAIGIVGARLERQPRSLAEAVATAHMLEDQGYNFSLGLVQVNQRNLARFGLSIETSFDPCNNLHAGGVIFADCLKRAGGTDRGLGDALSCYNSNNFKTGYRNGYVAQYQKIGALAGDDGAMPIAVIAVRPAGGRARKLKANGGAASRTPTLSAAPLFVSAVSASTPVVAPLVGQAPPPKSAETALLF